AATLVGQGLGASKPDRAERAVWLAGFYNMLFLGTVGAAFVLFAGPIVAVFTRDPAVAPVAIVTLRTISYGFLFYAYGMVITQSFNGAGDTWTPTWINLACFWLWEVPLAYWLARHAALGPRGVALAVMIAFSSVAVVSAVIFRRGQWKLRSGCWVRASGSRFPVPSPRTSSGCCRKCCTMASPRPTSLPRPRPIFLGLSSRLR